MTGTLVQCCWLLSDLCAGHCQWLHPDVLALWSGLVQDSPVHHLRHGLRLHLHPRTHGGRQVGQCSKAKIYLVNIPPDRFMAVVFPVTSLSYRTITNAKIAIALTWVTPSLLVIPVWYAHNLHTTEKRELLLLTTLGCFSFSLIFLDSFCCFDKERYSFSAFHISFFISSFAFPTLLILVLYIVMLASLWGCSTFRYSK